MISTMDLKVKGQTTCGNAKRFSLLIVSTQGSSYASCIAQGTIADTTTHKQVSKSMYRGLETQISSMRNANQGKIQRGGGYFSKSIFSIEVEV